MIFTCDSCGQQRDDEDDGGVVMQLVRDDGGAPTVIKGICFATPQCQAAANELFGAAIF